MCSMVTFVRRFLVMARENSWEQSSWEWSCPVYTVIFEERISFNYVIISKINCKCVVSYCLVKISSFWIGTNALSDVTMPDELKRKVELSQSVQIVKNVKSGMQFPVSASIDELIEELQISPSTMVSEYSGPNNVSEFSGSSLVFSGLEGEGTDIPI